MELIANNQTNMELQKWMMENGCSQTYNCEKEVDKYVDKRTKRGFYVNIVFVSIFALGVLLLIIDVVCMSIVTPYDRNAEACETIYDNIEE